MKDGSYELRAEIPGVDPAKDVEITVREGVLTIKSERSDKKETNGRSEFSYGAFSRSLTLPRPRRSNAMTRSRSLTPGMPRHVFRDRREAGRVLAGMLGAYRGRDNLGLYGRILNDSAV
jgi:hypothetical protein